MSHTARGGGLPSFNYSSETLSIGKIDIDSIDSSIFLNQDKSVATLTDFSTQDAPTPSSDQNTELQTEKAPANNEKPLHIQVNEINLVGENKIHFIDRSVQPTYERTLYLDEFNISAIDNHKTDLSPFHFAGRSNEYAKINLNGGVSLFSELINVQLKGDINEVSLPPISSYVKQALGFELKSGQLDTSVDIKIKESIIAGKVGLFVRGLDMSTAQKAPDPSVLKEQTAIPLNVALGMLKDKKGNIKLNIPMSGSVDDPSFGLSNFLLLVTKKAAISQAKSYLMQTFVPYASVVSVAISAGEFAMKLRFQDLPFPPTKTDIDETQHQYMDQFIILMKDKPKTQVKICGIATAEDINLAPGTKVTDPEEIDRLRTIAKKRSENFKEYGVKVGGLQSSRMLLCKPQVTFDKKALPGVKIKI